MGHGNTSTPISSTTIDPRSGYCSATKTFHSLRPPTPLPPPSQPLSITSYIFSLLSPLPTHTALIDPASGATLSFPELHSQVHSLSSSLLRFFPMLLSKGQLAFILSPATIQLPVLCLSLLSLNVIISLSNPKSTQEEISHQLGLTNPTIAFATSTTAHLLPDDLPTVFLDSPLFRSFLQQAAPMYNLPAVPVDQSDPAVAIYTSGTTSAPKAVVLSHRNFIAVLAGMMAGRVDTQPTAVVATTRPMFHLYGFFVTMASVAVGNTNVLAWELELAEMLRVVERYRATLMCLAPTLLAEMVRLEALEKFDLSSLAIVASGGAPLMRDVAEAFTARFPHVSITQAYGMTEATAAVAGYSRREDRRLVYESVGRLATNFEAKIVDPITGDGLPPNTRGELWIRSPSIMLGYLGDAEATAAKLHPEGWLKTGDLCYFDDDGYLFVLDRLTELIKSKDYQVSLVELERVLFSHPEIIDAAVIPYPDEAGGNIPMACIVREAGSTLGEEQVIDFVARKVAPHQRIHRVMFTNLIPRVGAGKILRRLLVERAQEAIQLGSASY